MFAFHNTLSGTTSQETAGTFMQSYSLSITCSLKAPDQEEFGFSDGQGLSASRITTFLTHGVSARHDLFLIEKDILMMD